LTVSSSGAVPSQAIESLSLVGKDVNGEMLLSASYDNKERYSASQFAEQLGSALAKKPSKIWLLIVPFHLSCCLSTVIC